MRGGQLCSLREALFGPPSQTPLASHLINLSVSRNPQERPVGADMGRPEEAEATTTRACHCAHLGVELQLRVESDCDVQVTGASPNATK